MAGELDHKIKKVLKKIFYICRLDWTQYDSQFDRTYIREKLIDLLQKGSNINYGYSHFKGCLPLCEASRTGDNMVVKILLKHGATVNISDKNKCSPLYIASSQGHVEVVKTLISHKADVNSKNLTGYSPLLSAIENDHYSVAQELIKAGAMVNIKRPNICGVDMTVMTFVLLTKGNLTLAENLLDGGLLPHKYEKPISTLLLDMDHKHHDFFKKLVHVGFQFDSNQWIEFNKNIEDPKTKDMIGFLKFEKGNPKRLENLCRIVIRTSLVLSPVKKHIKLKVDQLQIPFSLKQFLILKL